jgi:hypothetical protein
MALARRLIAEDGLTLECRAGRRRAAAGRGHQQRRDRPRRSERLNLPPLVGGRQHPARTPLEGSCPNPSQTPEEQPEAPEAEEQQQEQFDPERAQAKIKKANQEAANLRARSRSWSPSPRRRRNSKTPAAPTGEADRPRRAGRAGTRRSSSRALRLEVAFEKGLTPAQAKRLVGGTRDELEADAEEILRDFPVKSDGRPKGQPTSAPASPRPPQTPVKPTSRQIEADLNAASRR